MPMHTHTHAHTRMLIYMYTQSGSPDVHDIDAVALGEKVLQPIADG